MSSRRPLNVSLFPFLSVLLCAIGVVIVIMSGQTLVALSSSHDQVVRIVGDAQGRTPVYVECRADEVELHPFFGVVATEALAQEGSPFLALLETLHRHARERYLVLLVRPDGIETFEQCLDLAQLRDLSVGKDALLQGGRLIFEDGALAKRLPGRRR